MKPNCLVVIQTILIGFSSSSSWRSAKSLMKLQPLEDFTQYLEYLYCIYQQDEICRKWQVCMGLKRECSSLVQTLLLFPKLSITCMTCFAICLRKQCVILITWKHFFLLWDLIHTLICWISVFYSLRNLQKFGSTINGENLSKMTNSKYQFSSSKILKNKFECVFKV